MARLTTERSQTLYDNDFFTWTKEVAGSLRSGSVDPADIERIAKEIEDMGNRDRRELISRTRVLLTHLIKGDIPPERQCNSWRATILEQRIQIRGLIEDSPSLQREANAKLLRIWIEAQLLALEETQVQFVMEPKECPSFNNIISDSFWLEHFKRAEPTPDIKLPDRKTRLRKFWNKLTDL